MDLYEAIEKRFSVRAYVDKPVEEPKLQRVLEAGRASPSARNRQERKFIVVRDPVIRQQLGAASMPFVGQAPVVIAVVGLTPDDVMFCGIAADPVDCSIAQDHMALAAVAEGLGSCWIGHFDQDACRKILRVPDSAWIIELMPLGYPAGPQGPRKRKILADVVSYDHF